MNKGERTVMNNIYDIITFYDGARCVNDIYMSDEIAGYLAKLKMDKEISDYVVEDMTVFETPGGNFGVVSVAFVEGGRLEHTLVDWSQE